MNNILIVGAHYDDTELSCGGAAAKWVDEGKTVYKLTLTDNSTDFKQLGVLVSYEDSKAASARACEILGITEITDFQPVECSRLVYSKDIMQRVESVIYQYEIDTVFMHYKDDTNQDHVEASRICLTAARHCDNVFQYQSNGYIFSEPYYPNFFVDISRYINQKKMALEQYSNEHNRFGKLFEVNIERNNVWGYANRCDYAEGFLAIKYIEK